MSSPLFHLRRTGAVLAASALVLGAAAPAHAIDGVGGDGVTSARDQYDSGPDATSSGTQPGGAGGMQPGGASGTTKPGKKPTRTRDRDEGRDDDGNGVLGDGAGGITDPDPGGNGVLGDGAQGNAGGGNGAADPSQAQRQLRQGSSLPFTGWTIAPVALLGAGLLGAGLALRRRARDA